MNNYDVDYVVGTSFEKLGTLLDPKDQGQVNHLGQQDNWNNKTYDVEDSAVGMIKMKNGAVINLRASWAINMVNETGATGEAYTMLAGTKGGLDTLSGQVRLNHVVGSQPCAARASCSSPRTRPLWSPRFWTPSTSPPRPASPSTSKKPPQPYSKRMCFP